MSAAHVEHIHVADRAGGPMRRLTEATAVRGLGLPGDRYAAGAGYWRDDRVSRDLTLVEGEALDAVSAELGVELDPGVTRRTITTRGVALNDLLDKAFWIGDALARGTSLCEPCRHLVQLTGLSLLRSLVHRGGLRADLLSSGRIAVGDAIDPVDLQDGVGVLVTRGDSVLVGRRLAPHGFGTWSVPGGKPLPGETAEECALRELNEETGLVGVSPRVVATTVDGFKESRLAFHTTFVLVPAVAGEVQAREPQKTRAWAWEPWTSLPTPLFPPVDSLVASGFRPV